MPAQSFDPWAGVEDLEGTAHYDALGAPPTATAAELRSAFRAAARRTHPDKPGGSATAFARVQRAWEVLSDPAARAAYNEWGKELRHRRALSGEIATSGQGRA